MAVYALASASGSPGVTTTALGLALEWPNQVLLVDADPVGGSAILAGFYRGTVAHPGTLVELWSAHRQGGLEAAVRELPLRLSETASLIPGPAGAAQAGGLTDLWPALAAQLRVLSQLGVDVLIDLGRLGHTHVATPLARAADELLLVMRSDLPSVAAVAAAEVSSEAPVRGLLIGPNRPYTAHAVVSVIKRDVSVTLPWAPEEAAVLSHGQPEPKRGLKLRKALRQAAEELHTTSITALGVSA
jgi:hypothetical protein